MGREGIEPPQSKTADLQSAELTTCSTYPLMATAPVELRPRGGPGTDRCALGADDGTRTRNRRFTKPLLYQLSYVGATAGPYRRRTLSAPGNDRAAAPDGSSALGLAGPARSAASSTGPLGGAARAVVRRPASSRWSWLATPRLPTAASDALRRRGAFACALPPGRLPRSSAPSPWRSSALRSWRGLRWRSSAAWRPWPRSPPLRPSPWTSAPRRSGRRLRHRRRLGGLAVLAPRCRWSSLERPRFDRPARRRPAPGVGRIAVRATASAPASTTGSLAGGGLIRRLGCRHADRRLGRRRALVGGRLRDAGWRRRPPGSTLGDASKSRIEPATAAFSDPIDAAHRDPHEQVAATADRRAEPLALAPDDERERAAQVGLAGGQRGVRRRPRRSAARGRAGPPARPAGRRPGASSRCSTAPAEALIADGRQRRLAMGREEDAVDARGLGAAQQRARRSAGPRASRARARTAAHRARSPGRGSSSTVGVPARRDDERDALVAVEAGQRGQRAALDLDDRDPQARRMEDELLERLTALRHDEQAAGLAAGDERLLDGPAAGDELLGLEIDQAIRRRWTPAGTRPAAGRGPRRRPGARRRPDGPSGRTPYGRPRADEPAVACRAAGLRTVAPVGRADGHRIGRGRVRRAGAIRASPGWPGRGGRPGRTSGRVERTLRRTHRLERGGPLGRGPRDSDRRASVRRVARPAGPRSSGTAPRPRTPGPGAGRRRGGRRAGSPGDRRPLGRSPGRARQSPGGRPLDRPPGGRDPTLDDPDARSRRTGAGQRPTRAGRRRPPAGRRGCVAAAAPAGRSRGSGPVATTPPAGPAARPWRPPAVTSAGTPARRRAGRRSEPRPAPASRLAGSLGFGASDSAIGPSRRSAASAGRRGCPRPRPRRSASSSRSRSEARPVALRPAPRRARRAGAWTRWSRRSAARPAPSPAPRRASREHGRRHGPHRPSRGCAHRSAG